jgi:hypothetical protein
MRLFLRSLLAGVSLFALMGVEGLDAGEFHCEEAVKHLVDCCGAETVRSTSCVAGRGCDTARPAIDDPLASEVRDLTCDEITARGWCDQAPRSPTDGGQ